MDYFVEDAVNVIQNLRNNPYGIKDGDHSIYRAKHREIDLNLINENLCQGKLVGIEKSLNESSVFMLLYSYNHYEDLGIVINILDEDEIFIITVYKRNNDKREHYDS